MGGSTGDDFAAVLCPAGYVSYGPGSHSRFVLDFAHVEAMVCFELDGPSHRATVEEDRQRDEVRVIRIKHGQERMMP